MKISREQTRQPLRLQIQEFEFLWESRRFERILRKANRRVWSMMEKLEIKRLCFERRKVGFDDWGEIEACRLRLQALETCAMQVQCSKEEEMVTILRRKAALWHEAVGNGDDNGGMSAVSCENFSWMLAADLHGGATSLQQHVWWCYHRLLGFQFLSNGLTTTMVGAGGVVSVAVAKGWQGRTSGGRHGRLGRGRGLRGRLFKI